MIGKEDRAMNRYLMTPGPVPISTGVSLAEARPLIGHRGAEFSSLFKNIEEKLGRLLRSKSRTVIFPSSGTGALESLAVNFAGPDTTVISVSCGVFGDRFREITDLTGAKVINVDIPPGEAVLPETVASAVASFPDAAILLLTQNETSTGVFNPVDEIISSIPKDKRPLVLVDGVSSVGAMPCYPEDWGIDGLATASQKGLLTPPGLGFVWLSQRAWEHVSRRKCPNYYFDLVQQRKYLDKDAPENPYTPPVSLYTALDAALDEILSDGWLDFRARAARSLAAGLEALGFELLVKDRRFRSPGVTAFFYPSDKASGETSAIAKALEAMGVDVAGGQGKFKGNLIRMSHYHDVRWPEISLVLGSLYAALGSARKRAGDFMARALEKWEEE
jgi:aspartate aminotransferase-like enzyme